MKINYGKHLIGNDDIQCVIKSLKSNNITQGENIFKFENALNKFFGSKYDEAKTNACHNFVNSTIPNGEERVKKVIQTLY